MKLKKADNGNIQILENDDTYTGRSFSDRLIVSGLDTKTDGGGVVIAFGNKNDAPADIIRKDDYIELIRGNASTVDPSLLTLEEFAEELDTNFFFSKLTPAPLIPSNRTVDQFSDLPSPVIDYDGQYWLVDLVQGSNWLLNRKDPGIYKSVGGVWSYRGPDVPAYFRDDQLLFTDDGGPGELTFTLDALTARRNANWPDKNGIISYLEEAFRDYVNNVSNPSYKEGRVFYDSVKKALSYYNDESDTTINTGQELVIKVNNNSGATIENGSAIRYAGVVVAGNPCIVKSLADTTENAVVSGIATHDILDGETGYVTRIGQVGGLDTSMFTIGELLYLSSTVAGQLTNIEQPIVTVVGVTTISDASDGQLMIVISRVREPFAIGQSFDSSGHAQAIGVIPAPLEGYTDTPFEKNIIITPTGSGGSFRATIQPLSVSFSGFYEIHSSLTIESSSNVLIHTELYINGVPTGLIGTVDFGNNQTDEGTAAISGITQSIISDTDILEIYVYSSAATIITIDNVLFNAKRIGTV